MTDIITPNWEDLSWWQKFTDKDPSRPAKTWKNRFFWSWPISTYSTTLEREHPRFKKGTFPLTGERKAPSLTFRTTRFKGETYGNKPLSNGYKFVWFGWFWGWKN